MKKRGGWGNCWKIAQIWLFCSISWKTEAPSISKAAVHATPRELRLVQQVPLGWKIGDSPRVYLE